VARPARPISPKTPNASRRTNPKRTKRKKPTEDEEDEEDEEEEEEEAAEEEEEEEEEEEPDEELDEDEFEDEEDEKKMKRMRMKTKRKRTISTTLTTTTTISTTMTKRIRRQRIVKSRAAPKKQKPQDCHPVVFIFDRPPNPRYPKSFPPRCALISERCRLDSSRRRREALVGRVFRRPLGFLAGLENQFAEALEDFPAVSPPASDEPRSPGAIRRRR